MQIYKTKLFTTNFSASFFSDFHNFSNFSNFIQWSFLWISWNPYTFLWKIYIFANKNKEFFEALQNKERERNPLVSKSFTFYYSYLCFPFVIRRLHSLLLFLCGSTFGICFPSNSPITVSSCWNHISDLDGNLLITSISNIFMPLGKISRTEHPYPNSG